MADVFISYARSTEAQARQMAEALRALGHEVWRDDELPAHRAYAEVIEERLRAAKAVVVLWSVEAVRSQWVRAEAELAREAGSLVQVSLDGATLPLPFNQIQCADLAGWGGDLDTPGWRKVTASVAELTGAPPTPAPSRPDPALPNKPSIAVLPFANLSKDPEQEYFTDGMVEEIVAALSRYKSIFVIASGSTLAFKGKATAPKDAARQLGVRYVLEGSVRKAGARVRIAVRLIDAHDGAQIWGDRFEDTLEDVFALQDKVALSVAATLEPAVREAEIRRISHRPTANMGSYDLYLRAVALLRTYVWSEMPEVIRLVERAVELDPDFATAMAFAARCHYIVSLYGWMDQPDEHRRKALEFGRRAMRIASDDALVISNTAMLNAYLRHDLEGAVVMADRAIALNPGSAAVWHASGSVRLLTGELDLAIEHLETSIRLNPVGPDRSGAMLFMAMARFQQHRFDNAIALANELFQQFENPTGCAILAASYGHMGQLELAAAALADYRRLSPQSIETFAQSVWRQEAQLKLFLDGIALAKGKEPSARPEGA
jgi:adenylate cyclase